MKMEEIGFESGNFPHFYTTVLLDAGRFKMADCCCPRRSLRSDAIGCLLISVRN